MTSLNLTDLKSEKAELEKDLKAFSTAYHLITSRVVESEDEAPSRYPPIRQWSGTCGVLGALELSIHALERTIEEMVVLLQRVEDGEIQDTNHKFAVIRGGKENG